MKRVDLLQSTDLLVPAQLEDILALDAVLSARLRELSREESDPVRRFGFIRDDVEKLVSTAQEIAAVTNSEENSAYDQAAELMGKWSAIAGYSGDRISVANLASDYRQKGREELRELYTWDIRGTVVSTSMHKTVTIKVERMLKDNRTGKRIKRSKKYLVHDEYGNCNIGDKIVAKETRPLSRRKRHSLATVITRAHG